MKKVLLLDIDDTLVKTNSEMIGVWKKYPDGSEKRLSTSEFALDPDSADGGKSANVIYDYREFGDKEKVTQSIINGIPLVRNLRILDDCVAQGYEIAFLTARANEEMVYEVLSNWLKTKVGDTYHPVKLNRELCFAINDPKYIDEKTGECVLGKTDAEKKARVLNYVCQEARLVKFVDDDKKNLKNARALGIPNLRVITAWEEGVQMKKNKVNEHNEFTGATSEVIKLFDQWDLEDEWCCDKFDSIKEIADRLMDEMPSQAEKYPYSVFERAALALVKNGRVDVEGESMTESKMKVNETSASNTSDLFVWIGRSIGHALIDAFSYGFPMGYKTSVEKCAKDIFYRISSTYGFMNEDDRLSLDYENTDRFGDPSVFVKTVDGVEQNLYQYLLSNVAKDFLKKIDSYQKNTFCMDSDKDVDPKQFMKDVFENVCWMVRDRLLDKEAAKKPKPTKADKEAELRKKYGLEAQYESVKKQLNKKLNEDAYDNDCHDYLEALQNGLESGFDLVSYFDKNGMRLNVETDCGDFDVEYVPGEWVYVIHFCGNGREFTEYLEHTDEAVNLIGNTIEEECEKITGEYDGYDDDYEPEDFDYGNEDHSMDFDDEDSPYYLGGGKGW